MGKRPAGSDKPIGVRSLLKSMEEGDDNEFHWP